MITASNGTVYKRKKGGKDWWYLRLYLVDTDAVNHQRKYRDKYIPTGLLATKKNMPKANALLYDALQKYTAIGEQMPFDRYCQYWLIQKKAEVEITTFEGYSYKVQHIIDYYGDNPVTLGELSPQDIKNFYGYLLIKKKACPSQRDNKGLSNRTIKDIAVLLRSILEEAVDLEYIRHNPSANVKIPKRPQEETKRSYIGSDEVGIFLDAIKGHRLETVFILCLLFGLRREEVLGLRWSAIRDGKMFIEHTVARVKTTVAKDRTKNHASSRSYVLSSEVMSILDNIRTKQETNRKVFGKEYHENDYVFTWEDGRPYSPDYVTKSFKKVVRKDSRLDSNLHLHDLRASCVSILIHSGRDVKEVQNYVGHSDAQTTLNIYARSNERQQTEVVNAMTGILFSS